MEDRKENMKEGKLKIEYIRYRIEEGRYSEIRRVK